LLNLRFYQFIKNELTSLPDWNTFMLPLKEDKIPA
jgi:hypothetical protein